MSSVSNVLVAIARVNPGRSFSFPKYHIVSNQANGVVSYIAGTFEYDPSTNKFDDPHGQRTFSNQIGRDGGQFDPYTADQVWVQISLKDDPVKVFITPLPVGNGQLSFEAQTNGSVIYGIGSQGEAYILSVQKES
jgi:hypothetical protein